MFNCTLASKKPKEMDLSVESNRAMLDYYDFRKKEIDRLLAEGFSWGEINRLLNPKVVLTDLDPPFHVRTNDQQNP